MRKTGEGLETCTHARPLDAFMKTKPPTALAADSCHIISISSLAATLCENAPFPHACLRSKPTPAVSTTTATDEKSPMALRPSQDRRKPTSWAHTALLMRRPTPRPTSSSYFNPSRVSPSCHLQGAVRLCSVHSLPSGPLRHATVAATVQTPSLPRSAARHPACRCRARWSAYARTHAGIPSVRFEC